MIIGYRCLLLAVTGLAFIESSTTDAVPQNCTDVRINNGPLITPCVSEIILQKGQNFTLTCKGTTNIRFRQQEVSEEVTSNFKIVNTSSTILEDEYSFESTLNLYDVDQYAIGYYACSDDSVDANIVNNIVTEPENDEHVSYIYVYVNGTDSMFAPMREFIVSRSNKILIECRPTTPDVEVYLLSLNTQDIAENVYSPKVGFIFNYVVDTRPSALIVFSCEFRTKDRWITKDVYVKRVSKPPEPIILYNSVDFLENETFTLNCTAKLDRNTLAELFWIYPETVNKDNSSITEETNSGNVTEGILYKNITIHNATKKHEGQYKCLSKNSCESKYSSAVEKKHHAEPFINITLQTRRGFISRQPAASILFVVKAYPNATITFQKNGRDLFAETGKYKITQTPKLKQVKLVINPVDVTDNANFTLIASNGYRTKNETFEEIIGAKPAIIDFGKKICVKGMDVNIKCDVSGYPLPQISWMMSYNNTNVPMKSASVNQTSIYNVTAYLVMQCEHTGNISCKATNTDGFDSKTNQFLVYDIIGGFGINTTTDDKTLWVLENDVVTVKCLASIYEFIKVNWAINDGDEWRTTVDFPNHSEFSHLAELKIDQITLNHTGNYECYGEKADGSRVYDNIQINVIELQPPVIKDADEVNEDVRWYKYEYLNCSAVGAPLPEIKWFKDGEPIVKKNNSNVEISYNNLSLTAVNSTLTIQGMQGHNVGTYECLAVSKNGFQKKTFKLKLTGANRSETNMHYMIAIAVITLILIIMIVYLTLKIKKEKRFRKELLAAGLLYFKEGVTKSINPDLGIDEQAELLPYDEKFEFPSDRLTLGKQLGAGAFGVVYKAEARGIVNAEETTPVAVKMVKKTADNMYIKALASELKIMVHLGKHINIVNLLGACTKNVGKRELVVIVEYCKYGNIHNYMQRHREVFIDQLDTDNKEKLGKVNRAYTSSSCGSTGVHSDYFGSTNTQDTDHTILNTANTVRSVRKTSEGYVQPEWRSNYESDYSYDGRSPRPLTSRDLLAWSFQISRGMEYLASRKVLHGDLAARNILLADDNIVKICDFGLAKSIYKNEEYHKKENSPLPVKWLAIECMTDRIFSTQSDVWSFGIVLWELFTLAKTPYPNIHPASLLQFLSEGHRLDKPSYADDKLYEVMKKCWETKPTLRPTFSQLQEILGTFLEENVRNHYVDLNSTYKDKNVQVEGQEDYLAMMCAPDYNNLVTPSPHYVNTDKSFFPPTPVKVDDEGYLQISPANQGIFSPRVPNTEFDFDPRKLNPKVSEANSCGSELTPMLTLNNLPARSGSESDHEGNPPYLIACPRIDEEADEVFALNLNDTKNAKNIQQSAVTNPTYITFDNFDEKPKDIINNYVNINVPNGLVK